MHGGHAPATAKLADFMPAKPEPKSEGKPTMKFHTNIRCRKGKNLTVSLPASFHGRRIEVYYSNGTLIVAEAKKDEGCGVSQSGTTDYPTYMAQFGYYKWVDGMPETKLSAEVEWQDGQFSIEIPEPQKRETVTPPPAPEQQKNPRESATKCITYLNAFAAKNGYTFDVSADGKLSLVKIERIG